MIKETRYIVRTDQKHAYFVDGSQKSLQQILVPGLFHAACPFLLDGPGAADVAQQGCRAHNGCLTRQGLKHVQKRWAHRRESDGDAERYRKRWVCMLTAGQETQGLSVSQIRTLTRMLIKQSV